MRKPFQKCLALNRSTEMTNRAAVNVSFVTFKHYKWQIINIIRQAAVTCIGACIGRCNSTDFQNRLFLKFCFTV